MENMKIAIYDPYPGKFTSMTFKAIYWDIVVDRITDFETKCGDYYVRPSSCELMSECYKPVSSYHDHPKDYFLKIKLPEGITVNHTLIGKVIPCFWGHRMLLTPHKKPEEYYLCYYMNNTHIYAFNSIKQVGFCPNSGDYDVNLHIDGLYIHENITSIKKESGLLKFGFYETDLFVSKKLEKILLMTELVLLLFK